MAVLVCGATRGAALTVLDYLTKSDVLIGLHCRKKLWLYTNRPELASPRSAVRRRAIEQGNEVGILARTRFPDGVLIASADERPEPVVAETAWVMSTGAPAVFEAGVHGAGVYVRVDVLQRAPDGWLLVEVKSASRRKPEHVPDVAVQRYACDAAGIPVVGARLMHLNRSVEWPDEEALFETEDLDAAVAEWQPRLPDLIVDLDRGRREVDAPDVPVGTHCTNPYACPFQSFCWRGVPTPSIFDIPKLDGGKRNELAARGLLSPEDLPEDEDIPAAAFFYRDLYRSKEPVVDWEGVSSMMSRLEPPLSFLDFETDNPAIPRFVGTRPYEHIPFQYSLHVVASLDDLLGDSPRCTHAEYLHTDRTDPRRALAERLIEDLAPHGSIVAYWAGFERRVIAKLAATFPDLEGELRPLVGRFWDLYDLFKRYYDHPGFLGSKSLKRVLPVLVPSLSYDGMEVGDGVAAQVAWNEMIGATDAAEAGRLEQALLEYCRQDTYAMVALSSTLYRSIKGGAAAR